MAPVDRHGIVALEMAEVLKSFPVALLELL
jgi:hypothetical protein